MMSKEYCRYIRTYSELEGLQHAHTLVYCGACRAGRCNGAAAGAGWPGAPSAVRLQDSFARAMQLLRYLCENSVGLEQWLDVLTMQARVMNCWKMQARPGRSRTLRGKLGFCAICRF